MYTKIKNWDTFDVVSYTNRQKIMVYQNKTKKGVQKQETLGKAGGVSCSGLWVNFTEICYNVMLM